jgi:hypothetical protein
VKAGEGALGSARRQFRSARQSPPGEAVAGAEDRCRRALMMAVGRAKTEDTGQGDLVDLLRNPVIA